MNKDKLSCNVIQDLLPLYEDGCCSVDSKALVEEHLKKCITCQKKCQSFQTVLPQIPEISLEKQEIKRSMRKIKRARTLGISALALSLTLFLVIIPILNYVRGFGITYANLEEIHTASQFLKALSQKDYEQAYGYYNIAKHYDNLETEDEALLYSLFDDISENNEAIYNGIAQIKKKGVDWYNGVAKENFFHNMQTLEESKLQIASYTFKDIDKHMYDSWDVIFIATLENGTKVTLEITVTNDAIDDTFIYVYDNSYKYISLQEQSLTDYLNLYYQRPSFNETILEIIYKNTSYDWTHFFDPN